MTSPRTPASMPDADLDEADVALLTATLLDDLEPVAPAAAIRELLLRDTPSRLERFADALAALIDVTVEKARALLDRALDPSGWEALPVPGATTLWVEGGPLAVACIRGFLRIPAGVSFPHHTHLGEERVLVLDGCMIDSSGEEFLPGYIATMPAGSSHEYTARPGGTDLLIFAIVKEGIDIGDTAYRHRDG